MPAESIEKVVFEFMKTNPTENEIEWFYLKKVLPLDKRSIDEILKGCTP
jgi:aspartate/glutamate racemase